MKNKIGIKEINGGGDLRRWRAWFFIPEIRYSASKRHKFLSLPFEPSISLPLYGLF